MSKPTGQELPVILPQGATIQAFPVGPNNHNIVLGFDNAEAYRKYNKPYFGETIGRYANRTSNAVFSANGTTYKLAANNAPNSLHGGATGWGKKDWKVATTTRPDAAGQSRQATQYTLVSPHLDENYPGEVTAHVYTWAERKIIDGRDTTVLEVEYEASLTGNAADEPGVEETVISLTNHSYFNLTSGPTISGTKVHLPSTLHQPVDKTSIPLGPVEPFPGIPQGQEFEFGPDEPKIDHCLLLGADPANIPIDTRSRKLAELISLEAPDTKIRLVVESTESAFQCYTGDMTDVPSGPGSQGFGKRSGVAIEPSRWVNAVNVPEWRSQVNVKRGQTWGSRIRYTASAPA